MSDPREGLENWWENIDLGNEPDQVVAEDEIGELVEAVTKRLCTLLGHDSVQDHCGFPAHDYCRWCLTRTPGEAAR